MATLRRILGPFQRFVQSRVLLNSFHFQIKGWLHQYLIVAQIFNREDPVAELQDDVEDQEEKIRSSVKEEKNDILKKMLS